VSGGLILGEKKEDPWKSWLKEVEPILTRMERSVAKLLKTEEERSRFQDMFWKARDPIPRTPLNEYKQEYYHRIRYADQFLKGVKSDRGRIYVLLGKPSNKTTFVGHRDLVECELWNYESEDRPGLLPFMNLIFYRPRNTGDYQLFHPGIHGPRDLLSPQKVNRFNTKYRAYKEIKMNSGELASASLSIIPGEGDPRTGMSLGSSNFALNRVYTLPEREAELGYIRGFKSPTGSVQVSHSTRAVRGFGYITIAKNKGMNFVHYAVMPEHLTMAQTSKDLYSADIHLHINIETPKGGIIYQHQRKIPFSGNIARYNRIKKRKVVFRDFAPIIEGEFNVAVTYINNTTKEFFTIDKKVRVNSPPIIGDFFQAAAGYGLKEIKTGNYMPFAVDGYLVLTDPRSNFSQKDAVEGVVLTSKPPEIFLEKSNDKTIRIVIEPLMHTPGIYKFRKPLSEVKDGNYWLTVKKKDSNEPVIRRKIHVLPFYISITRPLAMEKPESSRALSNYLFVRAQQYMNTGRTDRAIKDFNLIPEHLWQGPVLPVIAKSYYSKGDYARTMELLEKDGVKKEYPVLMMLANSAIELKRFPKALQYLQKIREYGDTPEINQLVAATYLSMGDRENAKAYYERARKLKEKQ
jgi:GWxTD domain-containing protein